MWQQQSAKNVGDPSKVLHLLGAGGWGGGDRIFGRAIAQPQNQTCILEGWLWPQRGESFGGEEQVL